MKIKQEKTDMKDEIGVGLPTILFVVFLVLKLTGNIDWSWWWVTSPLWIPVAFAVTILVLAIIIAAIVGMFGGKDD